MLEKISAPLWRIVGALERIADAAEQGGSGGAVSFKSGYSEDGGKKEDSFVCFVDEAAQLEKEVKLEQERRMGLLPIKPGGSVIGED